MKNYKAFLPIGITFFALGIVFLIIGNSSIGITFFALGIVFGGLSFATNRKKN